MPALFTYIGYSLMFSSMSRGRKSEGGSGALIGIGFMAFSWVLTMFTLYLSRMREYYADRHSASVVDYGSQKLSTGLAKIVNATRAINKPTQQQKQKLNAFKALFIADPDRATTDSAAINTLQTSSNPNLVQEILSKKLTMEDKIKEVFSTHPNIIKRLRALRELSESA